MEKRVPDDNRDFRPGWAKIAIVVEIFGVLRRLFGGPTWFTFRFYRWLFPASHPT